GPAGGSLSCRRCPSHQPPHQRRYVTASSQVMSAQQPTTSRMKRAWYVSCIGARQHYAVPRALERLDRLEQFFTDAWVNRSRRWLARGPAAARSFANRYHHELPQTKVTAFNAVAVRDAIMGCLFRARGGRDLQ